MIQIRIQQGLSQDARIIRQEVCKRKINQCIEKAPDLCYPFFISLGL